MADLEVSKLFLPTPVELLYEIALLNSCDNYFTRKFFALTNCPDMDGFSLLGIGDLSTDGSVDIGRGCDDLDIYLPAFSGVSFRMPPVK
jgi:hypothetical protein